MNDMVVRVTANGQPFEVVSGVSVGDFIRQRGLDPAYVIVERNGLAMDRRTFEEVRLEEGDRLELVRAVAGG
jgi:sulfur carrier protein